MLVLLAVPVVPAVLLGEDWVRGLWSGELPDRALIVAGAALLASDILLPVPSGPLLVLLASRVGWPAATAAGVIGLTVGGLAGYALARWGGRPLAVRWAAPDELARWEQAIAANGSWMVLASRPIPVAAEAVTLAAGLGRMTLGPFVGWLLVGNLLTSLVFSVLGQAAAQSEVLSVAVVLAVAAPLALHQLARNRHNRRAPKD
ncbi:SNARE associated Golgi protein [Posidoniimonas polymericola]|uniref:SNARE associated Golgi protein n=1 Tax=Posidoniimonas polymericola TaxID=2528002 RepID=A0A5C5ZDP3_9BACT|nr:VTT domain-containing protein [Posidoniimonas polymericola]TWT85539.1 SNARE associated Golgi protein [Posidoniimonas polymericola]